MTRRSFVKHSRTVLIGASMGPLASGAALRAQPRIKRPIFIDADTANEIDDLYAIVRALLEPGFEIVGLSSAQWNHRLSPDETVSMSQEFNEELLRLMDRGDIPAPVGAEMIMGKPWGGTEPRDSDAAQSMIRAARAMPDGERLIVASLGAATNVASAVAIAPDIIPRIACYNLAGRYDAARGVWDKDEFNVRNDLNAANYLFNLKGLELHIMPVTTVYHFRFQQDETVERLRGRGPVWDFLVDRWLSFAPDNKEWIMWDLGLIEAIASPALSTEEAVATPPENTQREVSVYTSIDVEAMLNVWWRRVDQAIRD